MTTELSVITSDTRISMDSADGFELAQRRAKALASSSLVPQAFQGKMEDCLIGVELAMRMGASPFAVLQSLHVIHGKPSFSAAFLIGAFNTSGRFEPINYEFSGDGDDYGCVAVTTYLKTSKEIRGPRVTLGIARAEGWSTKNGSKWNNLPDLMLSYRAATFLIRTTAPEIALGMQTSEELHDIQPSRTVSAVILPDTPPPVASIEPPAVAEPESEPAPADEPPAELQGGMVNGTWCGQVLDPDTGEVYWADTSTPPARYDTDLHGWSTSNKMPSYTQAGLFRAKRTAAAYSDTRTILDLDGINGAGTVDELNAAWEVFSEPDRTSNTVMAAYNDAEARIAADATTGESK